MNELNPQNGQAVERTAQARGIDRGVAAQANGKSQASAEAQRGKELPPQEERPAVQEPRDRVDNAVVALNDYVQSLQRDLKFTVDPELGRPVVSVVDSNTQQVIRQIPNDVAIRLARNLKEVGEEIGQEITGAATENAAADKAYSVSSGQLASAIKLIDAEI